MQPCRLRIVFSRTQHAQRAGEISLREAEDDELLSVSPRNFFTAICCTSRESQLWRSSQGRLLQNRALNITIISGGCDS